MHTLLVKIIWAALKAAFSAGVEGINYDPETLQADKKSVDKIIDRFILFLHKFHH
jgi:hypothetical protein